MLKVFTFMCATFAVVMSLKNYNYNEYRNLYTCKGLPHIFFVYQSEKPALACDKVYQIGFKNKDKKKLLDLHNSWRQRTAMGEAKPGYLGPLPPARVMRDLKWDEELEDLAQRWVNRCTKTDPTGRFCFDSERFEVRQWNIECRSCNASSDNFDVVRWIDKIWGYALNETDPSVVPNYRNLNPSRIELAKILWADTKYVGCGFIQRTVPAFIETRVSHQNTFDIVCNYGPRGTFYGKPIYPTF